MDKYFLRLIMLVGFLIISCEGDNKKKLNHPEYAVGVVDSIEHKHKGKGYYRLWVYYSFYSKNEKVIGNDVAKGLYYRYTMDYHPGDSVLIKFEKGNPSISKLVRRTSQREWWTIEHGERSAY